MDTDRLLRIFGRMMDTHGTVFIGALAAIVALLLLVFVTRKLKNRKTKPKPAKQMMAAPELDMTGDMADDMAGDTSLSMADDEVDLDLTMMDDFDNDFADADIIADMKADTALDIDELDSDIAAGFASDINELDDLDDITIPKIGEAPPPKQSRFFSASWLGRKNKENAPTISLDMTPSNVDMKAAEPAFGNHKSAAECARLGEIERRLMALRELYEAGLIAPEVYVVKAREFAAQV